MQLKSLWIKDYKNLKNFEINFEKGNGLSILIGNNGSGKSNLLEAISGIFADWYGTPSGIFGTDYKIEYDLDGKNIILEQIYYKRYVNGVFFKDSTINSYLPNNIIALYSGEDSRLFKNFYLTRYNSYLKDVFENGCIGKMGLYYVNKDLWNISLLTLILFMNDFQDVKDFLNTELGIKNDRSIEHIDILMDWEDKNYNKTGNMALKAFIDKITPDGRRLRNPYFAEYLRELISNSSDNFEADPREVFNLFMHASIPEEFQIITGIEIAFNNGQTLESLSEGEKKLILIKAILKFVADEKSLLLLDEPDANIHEARKRKLYNLLKETPNRDVVMTTHSPTIVDISNEDELIVLKFDPSEGKSYVCDINKIEQIRYLTGNRINIFSTMPVLYCEGGATSIEAELYPILFPEFNVIPSGGHTEVINYTKMYNKTFNPTNRAVGIIDGDYICQSQRESLENEGIYSLSVLEVENVLMDMILLEAAKNNFCSDSDCLDKVKEELLKDCDNRKNSMSIVYTKNHIVSRINSELSTEGNTLQQFKDNIASIANVDRIDELYKLHLQKLETYLSNGDINGLIPIFDFNHNINRFTKSIVDDYQRRIVRLLGKIESLRSQIRKKYYANVH
jgi:energy-coupling factor transporter ATP-binding protein EcfA2